MTNEAVTQEGKVAVYDRDANAPNAWRRTHVAPRAGNPNLGAIAHQVDIDGDTVVLASKRAAGDFSALHVLQRTADPSGGATWEEISIPFRGDIEDVSVQGDIIAVSQRSGVTILERNTRQNGSWESVATLPRPAGLPQGAVELSGNHLAVVHRLDTEGVLNIHELGTGNWVPVAEPSPGSTQPNQRLGEVLAMSDDVLVVGAPRTQNTARGGANVGAAYVFHRDDGHTGHTWKLAKELLPAETISGDRFGAAVAAANGRWIAIGAPGHDLGGVADAGSLYLFQRTFADDWVPVQTLRPQNPQEGAGFGSAIGLADNLYQLAGSPGHDNGAGRVTFARRSNAAATWEIADEVNVGNKRAFGYAIAMNNASALVGAPESLSGSGEAVVLSYQSGAWEGIQGFAGGAGARFGAAVAIGTGRFGLIGEPGRSVLAVNLFDFAQSVPLTPPEGIDSSGFGSSVALNGRTALVGAPASAGGGAVFTYDVPTSFRRPWKQRDVLLADRSSSNDAFGSTLAISGRNVAIGSPGAGTSDEGRVEVFRQRAGQWRQARPLQSSDGKQAGGSVAIDGDIMVVGIPHRTMINPDGDTVLGPPSPSSATGHRSAGASPPTSHRTPRMKVWQGHRHQRSACRGRRSRRQPPLLLRAHRQLGMDTEHTAQLHR